MQDDDWIEVEYRSPADVLAGRQPRRKKPGSQEPGEWHTIDPADPTTWPPAERRIEIVTSPGGIIERCPWYTHAFAHRNAIRYVDVPIVKAKVPIQNIKMWRLINV